MATSKLVKPHTPHPTPHTLSPLKDFFSKPYLDRGFFSIAVIRWLQA
ncbi:hypothetical protein [Microcystis aeruginosa]|nr:hypothetical protein [Microcystis aeruginosa]